DLARALGEGLIRGASIDVYENEPPADSPLCGIENICHTPHLAASTIEAQIRCGVVIAGQVADYLKKGKVTGAVNDVAEVEKNKK
ncbi:MAG: NAD(P)-dependent oxidoreductase, partial [Elusimicrobiota bacterium]